MVKIANPHQRIHSLSPSFFLVACTRLYKPLCRSVSPSVGRSVRRLVRPSVRRSIAVHKARNLWRSALFPAQAEHACSNAHFQPQMCIICA